MISIYLYKYLQDNHPCCSLFLSQITINICTSYNIASVTSKISINSLTVYQTSKECSVKVWIYGKNSFMSCWSNEANGQSPAVFHPCPPLHTKSLLNLF